MLLKIQCHGVLPAGAFPVILPRRLKSNEGLHPVVTAVAVKEEVRQAYSARVFGGDLEDLHEKSQNKCQINAGCQDGWGLR
jgi:hypothetical protein